MIQNHLSNKTKKDKSSVRETDQTQPPHRLHIILVLNSNKTFSSLKKFLMQGKDIRLL